MFATNTAGKICLQCIEQRVSTLLKIFSMSDGQINNLFLTKSSPAYKN